MAKNWTLAEGYRALMEGDKSAVLDFGKRFPITTMLLSKAVNAQELLDALPSHMTMRKIEMAVKDGVTPYVDEEVESEAVKPEKVKPVKKEAPKKGRPKAQPKKEEPEGTENPYEGMSAPELFKACKKRGITAQPKQKTTYYIDLLMAADEKESDAEEEAEDDWEDEEEAVEEKPKKGKAAPAKSASKGKEKKEAEADDDDDWDL